MEITLSCADPGNFEWKGRQETQTCISELDGNAIFIRDRRGKKKEFRYDHVYNSDGNQQHFDKEQRQIFDELGQDLLQHVWDGYNCTLFAYGQTGSGKSYSLMQYGINKGIVPRIAESIFNNITEKEKENDDNDDDDDDDNDLHINVSISMMEIYNEKSYDLLSSGKRKRLTIVEKGGVFVAKGLTERLVSSENEVREWLLSGYQKRSVASTSMNENSSRAHTIVTLCVKIYTSESRGSINKTSHINIVDLAGSERTGKANTSGDRFVEGTNINKSLSVLGLVIENLAKQQQREASSFSGVHVPYRDSALTKILKNSLGGNSKTVMLATISPALDNFDETISTLHFALRVMKIKNRSKVNEEKTQLKVEELLHRIKDLKQKARAEKEGKEKLKEEIEQLRLQIYELSDSREGAEKNLLDTLKEEHKKNHSMRESTPHLLNLNEDAMLSKLIAYFIAEVNKNDCKQKTENERSDSKKQEEMSHLNSTECKSVKAGGQRPIHCTISEYIQLSCAHNIDEMAVFENQNGEVFLQAHCSNVAVNGVELQLKRTEKLKDGDRVMLGNFSGLFVFIDYNHPAETIPSSQHISFEFAKREILEKSTARLGQDNDELRLKVAEREKEVREANAMAIEMNKPIEFELVLRSGYFFAKETDNNVICVKVMNQKNKTNYLWTEEEFEGKLTEMYSYREQDQVQDQQDEDDSQNPFDISPETFTRVGITFIKEEYFGQKKRTLDIYDDNAEIIGCVYVSFTTGTQQEVQVKKPTFQRNQFEKVRCCVLLDEKHKEFELSWEDGGNCSFDSSFLDNEEGTKAVKIFLQFWAIPKSATKTFEDVPRGSESEIRRFIQWQSKRMKELARERDRYITLYKEVKAENQKLHQHQHLTSSKIT